MSGTSVRCLCSRCGKAWAVGVPEGKQPPYPYVCPECRSVTGDESGEKASTY